MCCTCIMSDNVLAVGLFWRNDLGCASVVPSEQTSSSYIILDIICGCFFIISHRKDLEFSKSSIWKRKKWGKKAFGAERTWTGDHLLKNLWSIHLRYLRVDECRWKKNSVKSFRWRPPTTCTSTALASVRNAQTQSFPFSSRETVVSELIFLG